MGLLGNGTKYNLAGRITTATTNLDGSNPSCIPAAYNLTAFRRNMLVSEAIKNPLASVPQGVRPPIAWMMAKEGGGISSYRRSDVRVSGTAAAEMGFPRSGAATLTLDGVAIGGLNVGTTPTFTKLIDDTHAIFLPDPDRGWIEMLNGSEPVVEQDGGNVVNAMGFHAWSRNVTNPASVELNGVDNVIPALYQPKCVAYGLVDF